MRRATGLETAPSSPTDLGEQHRDQSAEWLILQRVQESLIASQDPDGIVRNAVAALVDHAGYSHVGAFLVRPDGLQLVHQAGYEHPPQRLDIETGLCGKVARTGQGVLVASVAIEPDYFTVDSAVESEICVPFGVETEFPGVLNVAQTGPHVLRISDFRIVSEVAGLLSRALERAGQSRSHQGSERRLERALEAAAIGVWTWTHATGALEWQFAVAGRDDGLPADAIQSLDDLLANAHAGDFGHLEHAFSRATVDGGLDVEFRLEDGSVGGRWLNMCGQAVDRSPDDECTLLTGVVFDVTGRKRLEEERLRLVHLETARADAEEAHKAMTRTIERLRDGFVAVDSDLRITLVNEQASRFFGIARSDLLGAPLQDALRPIGEANTVANILATSTATEPNTFDLYDARVDRFLEIRVFPADDGTSLHMRDVTALRQAEYDRQRSEARFRSLVQQASDLILILDRQGHIQFASPAISRILGLNPQDLAGTVKSLTIHPDDDKRFRRAMIRVLRTPGLHAPFEARIQHRDGTFRWLEITATNLLADPLMQGVIANCRDITERYASEFNLWLRSEVSTVLGASLDLDQTLEALNRLLVTYSSDVSLVAVFSEQGELEQFAASARELFGAAQDAGRELTELAIDAIGIRSGRALSSRHTVVVEAAGQEQKTADTPYSLLAGRMVELNLTTTIVVPIVLRGQVRGVLMVGFGHDSEVAPALISTIEDVARRAGLAIENARLYRHARDAIEARDRFLSVAAHELRTPITAVTGYTSMLKKELSDRRDGVRIERYATRLDEAGRRLATLAEDLLDVAHIRGGVRPLRMGPVKFADLARQVVLRYAEQRSSARDRLVLAAAATNARVKADPDRLEQVLTNLIDNALKYSPPNTEIHVSVTADHDSVRLAVSDHGIGVDPGNLKSIFQPFGRAANAEESGAPGLGLGLYICRSIVERHDGRIWAESNGPGTGLTVTVELPLILDTPAATGED